VLGPYKGKELGDILRECDIYISASKYDSCPMHILEGISCGLPILYLDYPGGVKDICEIADDKIGESFKNIEECIQKVDIIRSNYEMYYKNIVKNIDLYHSKQCYADYTKLFLSYKI
jgi:glycosyltransferase involved in cell wall biosynthesis